MNLNLIKNDIYETKEEWSSHVIDCLVKEEVGTYYYKDVDMLFWCTIFAVELGWIEDSHDLLLSDSGGAYNDYKVWSYSNHNALMKISVTCSDQKPRDFPPLSQTATITLLWPLYQ